MAQVARQGFDAGDGFEVDFWRDESARKLWEDIVPGEPRETIQYTLTLEAIQRYCRAVGDLHPLYFDEEYAKKVTLRWIDRTAIYPHLVNVLLHPSDRLDAKSRDHQRGSVLDL